MTVRKYFNSTFHHSSVVSQCMITLHLYIQIYINLCQARKVGKHQCANTAGGKTRIGMVFINTAAISYYSRSALLVFYLDCFKIYLI